MILINEQAAIERFDGDSDLYADLLRDYASLTTPDFSSLRELLTKRRYPDVAAVIHRLKGGALTIGAESFAEVAGKLESKLRNEELSNVGELLDQSERLWDETTQAISALLERYQKPK